MNATKTKEWKCREVIVDAPKPEETGTIYEYEIRNPEGLVVGRTYEEDEANFMVNALRTHEEFVQALKDAEVYMSCQLERMTPIEKVFLSHVRQVLAKAERRSA